jgi:hypothetical protein
VAVQLWLNSTSMMRHKKKMGDQMAQLADQLEAMKAALAKANA